MLPCSSYSLLNIYLIFKLLFLRGFAIYSNWLSIANFLNLRAVSSISIYFRFIYNAVNEANIRTTGTSAGWIQYSIKQQNTKVRKTSISYIFSFSYNFFFNSSILIEYTFEQHVEMHIFIFIHSQSILESCSIQLHFFH